MEKYDVIVIGAGAAGLFCAAQLGQAGKRVLVVDNGKKAGRKILMSGGGRCNFTNLHIEPAAYLSHNAHFCKSALARYSQWDFLQLVNSYGIAYHEKTLGQLFCDDDAEQIVSLLLNECQKGKVTLRLRSAVTGVTAIEQGFQLDCTTFSVTASAVVVASGGLSMPGLGATPLGYQIAQQFGLPVLSTRAALVPFTLQPELRQLLSPLAGISVPVRVTSEGGNSFQENILFTHRGLSGPAILQISSYWQPGEQIWIELLPTLDWQAFLSTERHEHPNGSLKNSLAKQLPKRLVETLQQLGKVPDCLLKQLTAAQQNAVVEALTQWSIQPNGTEGYRTAEVTLGGVDTRALSSKTMQANAVPGLYFIGEVVDVTGWLGGYNFQWAWSSAWACAQALVAV